MKQFFYILVFTTLLYSCEGEKTIFVADHFGDCKQECLLIRENNADSWKSFENKIEGFTYEPGFSYELKVKIIKENNTLQYHLVDVVSKIKSPEPPIETGTWQVTTINNFKLSQDKTPSFSIKDGVIRGDSGCNSFSGTIQTQTDGQFLVKNIRATKKFCEDFDRMEKAFNSALSKVSLYHVKDDEIQLLDSNGGLLITATQNRKVSSLNNHKWFVSTIKGFQNKTGKQAFFSIDNGQIKGNSACNSFGGEITTDENGMFKVGTLRATKMFCQEADALERAFHKALGEVTSYKISDGSLMLYDESKYIVMTASTRSFDISQNEPYTPYIIEYTTTSPPYTEKFQIDEIKNKLTYSNSKTGENKTITLTKSTLKFFEDALANINLKDLNKPEKSLPLGQKTGVFSVRKGENIYKSASFSTNNPPGELKEIISRMTKLVSK